MALVKVKPTSAGRRAVVKVVNANLHKGAPLASLVESRPRLLAVIITATSQLVTRVVVTSSITALSISSQQGWDRRQG
jgi:hypothetical protein